MSLVHATTASLPDDPGFEIKTTQWNEEHLFAGAGAGEVVFVDGSGHAATSPNLTFDAPTASLTLGVSGAYGAVNAAQFLVLSNFGGPTYTFTETDTATISLGATTLIYNVNTLTLSGGFNGGNIGAADDPFTHGYFSAFVSVVPVAVDDLPDAATAGAGAMALVNDALAPAFGVAVADGGAVTVPVYSDGAAWVVG